MAPKKKSTFRCTIFCEFCGQSFSNRNDYYSHAGRNHLENIEKTWYNCETCQTYYPTNEDLVGHEKIRHGSDKRVSARRLAQLQQVESNTTVESFDKDCNSLQLCKYCPQIFPSFLDLITHCNQDHIENVRDSWKKCLECHLLLPDFEATNGHLFLEHGKVAGKSRCLLCSWVFYSGSDLQRHFSKSHRSRLEELCWCQCEDCLLMFPDEDSKSRHSHEDYPDFACDFCSVILKGSEALNNHINYEHYDEIYRSWTKCSQCSEFWPTQKENENHFANEHQDLNEESARHCIFCDKVVYDWENFFHHANSHHQVEIRNAKWRKCKLCDVSYPNEKILMKFHQNAHSTENNESKVRNSRHRQIQCDFCPKILCDSTEYYRHANNIHVDCLELWKSCDVCFVKMPNVAAVRKHKIRLHPGSFLTINENRKRPRSSRKREIILRCEFCSEFRFSSLTSLYKHVNKDHRTQILSGWLTCTLCNLKLPSKQVLERHHLKSHKIEEKKLTDCQFCERTFMRGAYFIEHANKEHLNEVRLSWQKCENCSKFWPTAGMLKSHLTRSHGLKRSLSEKLQCKFCNAFLSTPASYVAHSNDLHFDRLSNGEGGWLQCQYCKTYLPDRDILNNHINHRHQDKTMKLRGKVKSCTFCQKKFHAPLKVYRHISDDHRHLVENEWHLCDKCDIFFPTKLSLTFHNNKAKHSYTEIKENCPFCTSTFTGKGKMYRHANKIHKDQVGMHWLLCSSCDTYMPDETVLTSHMINAHSRSSKSDDASVTKFKKTIICEYCSAHSKHPEEYFQHINKDHFESVKTIWIPCSKCPLLVPSKKQLEDHENNVHQSSLILLPYSEVPSVVQEEQVEFEMSEFIVEIEDNFVPPSEDFQCTLCSESLVNEHEFYKHTTEAHFETVSDTWYMCTTCKLYIPSLSALRTHHSELHLPVNLPTMRITCTQCNEAFDKTNDFYWHVNQNHLDNVATEWSMCDVCNFFLPEYDSLMQHKAFFHGKET